MGLVAGGFDGGRRAAEHVRAYGLTFHVLDDGRGAGTLAQVALPGGWKTGRARLERDDVAGGPCILAFSATGPAGEELIYRSEIRSPQAAASAELRHVASARDARDFLAASCDRVAAQFGIRVSGAAEFAGERAMCGFGNAAHSTQAGYGSDDAARDLQVSGLRVYELNDGATAPLMLGVALAVERTGSPDHETASWRGAGGRCPWRAVDCYCLVTPHDRFEHVASTALAVAVATLRIDPATARLLTGTDRRDETKTA